MVALQVAETCYLECFPWGHDCGSLARMGMIEYSLGFPISCGDLTESAMWNVQLNENESRRIETEADLLAALDLVQAAAHEERPPLAVLTAPDGNSIVFGFTRDNGVVSFVPGDGKSPSYSSKGQGAAEEVVVFSYLSDWTEVPSNRIIPAPSVRQAVRHFFTRRELYDGVEWEQE